MKNLNIIKYHYNLYISIEFNFIGHLFIYLIILIFMIIFIPVIKSIFYNNNILKITK